MKTLKYISLIITLAAISSTLSGCHTDKYSAEVNSNLFIKNCTGDTLVIKDNIIAPDAPKELSAIHHQLYYILLSNNPYYTTQNYYNLETVFSHLMSAFDTFEICDNHGNKIAQWAPGDDRPHSPFVRRNWAVLIKSSNNRYSHIEFTFTVTDADLLP